MDKKALSFAEDAIAALGEKDAPLARTCVALACEVDMGMNRLADAVYLACAELEENREVSTATWNILVDSVPSGELLGVVESYRS